MLSACGDSESSTAPRQNPPIEPAPALATPVSITAGGSHTCALSDAGRAFCWGRGPYGALGVGVGTTESARPRAVAGSLVFATLAAGYAHTCGVTQAGAAHCWGFNYERPTVRGALGDGTETNREVPTAVVDGLVVREIAAGGHHSCGATTDNAIFCWGRNVSGELGTGDTSGTAQLRPVRVAGTRRLHGLALGYRWSCGLDQDNRAYCWGNGADGQVGNGSNSGRNVEPDAVVGGLRFMSLSSSMFGAHTCGVTTDSLAYCWGANSYGQLGDGTTNGRATPTRVAGGLKFTHISAGGHYTCGLLANGEAYCWGSIYAADRVGEPASPNPTRMTAPASVTFTAIAVGANHACALTPGKAVYCWGVGGTVGDGSQTDRPAPTPVAGFSTSPP